MRTRHNAGYWYVDKLAQQYQLSFKPDKKFKATLCRLQTEEAYCWLCKPDSYMNESGTSIKRIADFYRIPPEQILIAYDALEFEAGTIRLKVAGGHGGHNGLRHIVGQFSTDNFIRLRIGIGRPTPQQDLTPYVLGTPNQADQTQINQAIENALALSEKLIEGDIAYVMTRLNKKVESDEQLTTTPPPSI